MSLSKEELLKPRYLVIADYPHIEMDQHGVGDIISPFGMGFIYPDKVKEQYDKYPHLFRPLAWWEFRSVDEMPEYVKWVEFNPMNNEKRLLEAGIVEKPKYIIHGNEIYADVPSQVNSIRLEYFLPATETEYQQHINKQQ